MEGLFKATFFISILFTTNLYAQTSAECVSHHDLQAVAEGFTQFASHVGEKDKYCEADLGEQWLKVVNSLVALMKVQPNEPKFDESDGLTYKAISEKDWWSYFTSRADRIVIREGCPENVVAFVQPLFGRGTVNLCEVFFRIPLSSQASTMMHEVRHFDGFRHVTCSQGNEKGVGGACDSQITEKGSYAISVQTLVGMARSDQTSSSERPLLEAEAIYMAFNKFNIPPQVKLRNSLILSNAVGEVYSWTRNQGAKLLETLSEPAAVLNSANYLTIYPLNANSKAYRRDLSLQQEIESVGLYAEHYNSEPLEEREKYKSISYLGGGGLLKGNSLITLCDLQNGELGETNLDEKGQFSAIISMSLDVNDQRRESMLLADNGDIYRFQCQDTASSVVDFEKTELKISEGAPGIVDSFGFSGEQYALLDDGSLAVISLVRDLLQIEPVHLPIPEGDWVSVTPFSRAEVF